MSSFAKIDMESKGNYLRLLSGVSKLSRLFSDSLVPFVNYRAVENIFCKCFGAINLARSDGAYDANYKSTGIGIKTYVLRKAQNQQYEKVAEFNRIASTFRQYQEIDLAIKIGEARNNRIQSANNLYAIDEGKYHIVARKEGELLLYETDYGMIDLENIEFITQDKTSLRFSDTYNQYMFSFSKSTLFRGFIIPNDVFRLPIEILDDPFNLLLDLAGEKGFDSKLSLKMIEGYNYVILPLYSIKDGQKHIYPKSGLNQWNAGGRKRDFGEVYIKIPSEVHTKYPDFFPSRKDTFELLLPSGQIFEAKICQQGGKALMTNPNKALAEWLLRKVLMLKEGQLATMETLDTVGFDSVVIQKMGERKYGFDVIKSDKEV